MSVRPSTIFATHDPGLLSHWRHGVGGARAKVCADMPALQAALSPEATGLVWVDLALPNLPAWQSNFWRNATAKNTHRIIAASSNPHDDEGVQALDAGCVAYCHAYSAAATLAQIGDVVAAGQVWIGQSLMHRLLTNVRRVATVRSPSPDLDWKTGLTPREIQVATLAAQAATNAAIARACAITERTVKAHLASVFGKLNITDRLQLALRVHGVD